MARKATIKRGARFVSPWSYDRTKNVNSVTGGNSITVPNQAMSVREIMLRFTRGTPPLTRQAVYNEDYEIPDVDTMDFVEREEYAKQNAQHIRDLQELTEEAKRKKEQPEPAPAASGPRSDSKKDDTQTQQDE